MGARAVSRDELDGDPLMAVEAAAEALGWTALRGTDEELLLAVEMPSLSVQFSVQWLAAEELLQFVAMWDLRIPQARRAETQALAWMINARLALGHFEVWEDNGSVALRHAQVATADSAFDDGLARRLLRRMADACAQYHPAFQFVVWAGKSAREALDSCLFETMGEA